MIAPARRAPFSPPALAPARMSITSRRSKARQSASYKPPLVRADGVVVSGGSTVLDTALRGPRSARDIELDGHTAHPHSQADAAVPGHGQSHFFRPAGGALARGARGGGIRNRRLSKSGHAFVRQQSLGHERLPRSACRRCLLERIKQSLPHLGRCSSNAPVIKGQEAIGDASVVWGGLVEGAGLIARPPRPID